MLRSQRTKVVSTSSTFSGNTIDASTGVTVKVAKSAPDRA